MSKRVKLDSSSSSGEEEAAGVQRRRTSFSSSPPDIGLGFGGQLVDKLEKVAIFLRHVREGRHHSMSPPDIEELRNTWDKMVRSVGADEQEGTLFHTDHPSTESGD